MYLQCGARVDSAGPAAQPWDTRSVAAIRALIVCLALALVAPAGASAEFQWAFDSPLSEQAAGYVGCQGRPPDPLDSVLPSIDHAEVFLDQAELPRSGALQLVRVRFWHSGGDECLADGGTKAQVELIAPPGTDVAIGPEATAQCGFADILDASACPIATRRGEFGGVLLEDARGGQAPGPWPVTGSVNRTRLIIPLRLNRPMSSFATSAERRCAPLGPCAAGDSNGRVQFAVRFIAGAGAPPSAPLTTTVGLLGGKGASVLARSLRGKVKRSTLRRGLAVKVNARRGERVRLTLRAGGRTVAGLSRRASANGVTTLRLRASARSLRKLGRRTRAATLTVSVGTPPRTQTKQLRIGK